MLRKAFLNSVKQKRFCCENGGKKPKKDSSVPHSPIDPPENYDPTSLGHNAFEVPKGVPLKAYRQFCDPDEQLGFVDAGKDKCYKTPEYFSYHRYSFNALQLAAVQLRDQRIQMLKEGAVCMDEDDDDDDDDEDDDEVCLEEKGKVATDKEPSSKVTELKAKEKEKSKEVPIKDKQIEKEKQSVKLAKSTEANINLVKEKEKEKPKDKETIKENKKNQVKDKQIEKEKQSAKMATASEANKNEIEAKMNKKNKEKEQAKDKDDKPKDDKPKK